MGTDIKFGFIALLDALGTRTAMLENAVNYLGTVEALEDSIKRNTKITIKDINDENLRLSFAELKPRFFGDSILLSYEIDKPDHFEEYLKRILFVLISLISESLLKGIPLRGSLAIGKYIERANVVLGPAVNDAANWYEQQQMISIMTTPKASNYIKGALFESWKSSLDYIKWRETDGLFLYDIPLRDGKVSSYVVDWPRMLDSYPNEGKDILSIYYGALNEFEMPLGAEKKYANTELLIKHAMELRSQFLNDKRKSEQAASK